MRVFACFLFVILSACVPIQGSGNIETRTVEQTAEIRHVAVSTGIQVEVVNANLPSIRIQGDDNLITEIDINQSEDRLEIEFNEGHFTPSQPIVVKIGAPDLQGVEVNGGGRATLQNGRYDEIRFEVNGGSKLFVRDVVANTLHIDANGGSHIDATGSARTLYVDLTGGSSFDGYGLEGFVVALELSGGSRAEVTARESVTVDASGGSSVRLDGEARLETDLTGGSAVDR